ncbi:phosphate starvation protein PhoH [Corynebacterium phocae]|uniref:PhoH-like protein n=1 Tax=Corynebacterium phocae TaxID=161895 RepID=A0A1L7D215_9CORY|nr:PhoH family protein [Corynebacterium phocae]APT92113.1 phosphate starvation protein PhoH [Corynebacterium phocae]KAA8726500.1 PhoH family protein [Corynebacterium phocae]
MSVITEKIKVDSAYIATVLGTADENLRVLNNLIDADLFARGTTVTVTGPDFEVARAAKVLEELEAIARRGHAISTDTVKHTVDMVAVEAPQSVSAALAADIVRRRGKTVRPKTVGQSQYVQAIDDHTVVFGIGPAGSGKTYLAVAKAVQALQNKQVSRIILTRPAVEAGERLGFLPGTLNDKIDPYLRPLYDALRDMLDPEMIPKLMDAGIIEVAPLAYMRGRTLNDAFVILDEAQNTTPAQMKMFLTRLGFGSKVVVTGDISQVDLPRGQVSGLRLVREILDGVEDMYFADLGSQDVVRHQLVGRIVSAYDRFDAKHEAAAQREGK